MPETCFIYSIAGIEIFGEADVVAVGGAVGSSAFANLTKCAIFFQLFCVAPVRRFSMEDSNACLVVIVAMVLFESDLSFDLIIELSFHGHAQ